MGEEILDVIEMQGGSRWNVEQVSPNEEVLQMLAKKKPDALFLSFSSRDVNSLEYVKKIREKDTSLLICVCATIHSPDLISQWIMYGVDAYVSVPLQKYQFQQALLMFEDRLEQQRQEKSRLAEQELYQKRIRTLLEEGFVYSILYDNAERKQLRAYSEALQVWDTGCIVSISCKKNAILVDMEQGFYEKIKRVVRQIPELREQCVVGPVIMNRLLVYIGVNKKKMDTNQQRRFREDLTNKITHVLERAVGDMAKVQTGNIYPVEDIYKSYQETLRTSVGKEEKRAFVYRADRYTGHRDYVSIVNHMIDSIKYGREDADGVFWKIVDGMSGLSLEEKKSKLMQLLLLCCHQVNMKGANELQFVNCGEWCRQMDAAANVDEWAFQKFNYILRVYHDHRGRNTSNLVKLAIDYMERNYHLDITLEDVAKYVGVTPQHFSKIFKQETGIKYIDWISELRIEQAKQYLLSDKYNIKEVCYLVGYKDPNYFSRIFKKVVGMSPSDFVRTQR